VFRLLKREVKMSDRDGRKSKDIQLAHSKVFKADGGDDSGGLA
jgi:hypothetical protein